MDPSETVAYRHLVFRGFASVVYEPDGNTPPDFLLDGRIAVEVRRLNENERDSPSPKGLEETGIPLVTRIQELARSFGPAEHEAWRLTLRFRRPVPPWRVLAKRAREILEQIRDGHMAHGVTQHLADGMELEVMPRGATGGEMFHLAGPSDGDSGGWVVDETERNLRTCIDAKTRKVQQHRSRYSEWWLLLVDHVWFGSSADDQARFKQGAHISHDWDKVIIVSPLYHAQYFEL
ncbi:MAG: hypothetical protein ACRENI_13000 [Gemmatimonadaceae bacterium]